MTDEVDLEGRVVAERYRVERKIGSGGMGSVWAVQHVESHERYALKALHPRGAEQRMTVERFMREARAAAALKSRHIVRIIDAQRRYVDPRTGASMPFIVMELLEGANLERRIVDQGPLTGAELAWVLRGVGRALRLAHDKGIVHRDLKPENVFLALDDERQPIVKVCDFGVAKVVGPLADGLLSTGTSMNPDEPLLGTPMYMSPEQIRDASTIGPTTDQWSLALLAYKALAGEDYFAGVRSVETLLGQILDAPLAAPSSRSKRFDAAFDAWFARSCATDPARRWPNVENQVDALIAAMGVTSPTPPSLELQGRARIEAAATGAPLSSRPRRAPPTTGTSKRRLRWPLLLLLVAIVLGAMVGLLASSPRTPQRMPAAPLPTR